MNAGDPWLGRSVTSGRLRHSARTFASCDATSARPYVGAGALRAPVDLAIRRMSHTSPNRCRPRRGCVASSGMGGVVPKHVILFLAANPSGTWRLALDKEARSIHAELKRSGHRDRFEFVTRWAAEPLDLLRELRELKPTVVHFSGQREVSADDPRGLRFQRAGGGVAAVSPEAIAQTLDAVGSSVRLVVLNACFTEAIADAVLAHVDCVVGMSGSI